MSVRLATFARRLCASVLLALASAPAWTEPSHAQTARADACDRTRGTLSLTLENDYFLGTDRDYTNGVRIGYVTPCNDHFMLDRWLRGGFEGFYPEDADWYGVYAIGQNMYTPSDITVEFPDADERPYAGFLYGSIGLIVDDRGARYDTLDTLVLDIGVVGNASNAEHTQKLVHDIIDDRKPVGWDDQLEDEPAARLTFERKLRVLRAIDAPFLDLEIDGIPHIGASVGNVDTSAALGAVFRIGTQLDDDYGPTRVRPGLAGPGFFNGTDGISGYLFAGGEIRAVARDIFLQGNTYKSSKSVPIRPIYGDIQAGAALQLWRSELSFTYVARSLQYEGQSGWSQFGSVNLRFKW